MSEEENKDTMATESGGDDSSSGAAVPEDNCSPEESRLEANSAGEESTPPVSNKPAWGLPPTVPAAAASKASFAEIMKEQTEQSQDTRTTNDGLDDDLDEEERNLIELVLQQSLAESSNAQSAALEEEERHMIETALQQSDEQQQQQQNQSAKPAAKPSPEEMEREMIEAAIREADAKERETGADADVKPAAKPSPDEVEREMIEAAIREADGKEQESGADAKPAAKRSPEELEREMIEAAIREADEKQRMDDEAESLRLVLLLQQEELTRARERQRHQEQTSLSTGNVRTMTRAEFAAEKYNSATSTAAAVPPPDLDVYGASEETGFRMNQQQTTSGGWYRRDRNTIVGPNNEVRTKHDVQLQGQTNASFLDLDVIDDDTGLRTHVGNTAFNAFRKTVAGSYHAKGGHRGTTKGVASHGTGRAGSDADATKGGALDQHVRLQISKAINAGIIERCNGVVKQGKEAVVYHAVGGLNCNPSILRNDSDENRVDDGTDDENNSTASDDIGSENQKLPAKPSENDGHDVAIKVFKRIKEFRGRGEYVDGDPRYAGRPFRSFTEREQLEVWTEKEYRNLVRAYRAKVPVPNPIHYKENVIFMRFLGEEGWPAPQIREIQLRKGSNKWIALYEQVMESVQLLFRDARLVHGDLSEYNILVAPNSQVDHKNVVSSGEELQTALIDFGQAVEVRHPKAEELLRRDLSRVNEFFTKQGVTKTMSEEDAFRFVIGDHSFSINTTNDAKRCPI